MSGTRIGDPGERVRWRGLELVPDMHCPTWQVTRHKGWRGFLIYRLGLPRRFFRPEKKERILYWLPDGRAVVSFETYALVKQRLKEAEECESASLQSGVPLDKVPLTNVFGEFSRSLESIKPPRSALFDWKSFLIF